jgi:integrase/recombinase XerD
LPEPNLYKRGATWWLRTSINGAEHRESLRCGDVKSARARRDKRLQEIAESRWSGPRRSWQEAVTAYVEHAADHVAPNTLKRYAVSLMQCAPFLETLDVAAIDGAVIMGLIAQRRKAATNATVKRDLTVVSQVLAHSEALGWREGNPALTKRKLFRERRDPIVLPDPKDVELVIARCGPRLGALVRVAWLTGCRQNELVTAEWRYFNAKARTLEIIGKGNHRRTISLSGEASAQIAAQPRALGSDLIFYRDTPDGPALFENAASDFGHVRKRVEKSANGFRRFRYHDLRHLFAVEELRRGRGIYDLQKHLGHSSVQVTELYLQFLTPEEAELAKAKMG